MIEGLEQRAQNARDTHPKKPWVITALLHDLLREQTFDSYADVAEALKCRCARLRIPYDGQAVWAAIVKYEQGGSRSCVRPVTVDEESPTSDAARPVSRAEAARICAAFGIALRKWL